MSSCFSAKSGSLLTLKLFMRCGLSPLTRQMRATESFEIFISLAIVRVDQCVVLTGALCVVFEIRAEVTSEEISGTRPGRGASFSSPSIPCSRKGPRHRLTMRGVTFRVAAISLF